MINNPFKTKYTRRALINMRVENDKFLKIKFRLKKKLIKEIVQYEKKKLVKISMKI